MSSRVEDILQGETVTPQSRIETLLIQLVASIGGSGSVDEDAVLTIVNGAIADLVNGAPQTFDTLKELADWISAHQEIYTALVTIVDSKQDQLTFDNAPTASSNNPVKSGGVYTAIDAISSRVAALEGLETEAF